MTLVADVRTPPVAAEQEKAPLAVRVDGLWKTYPMWSSPAARLVYPLRSRVRRWLPGRPDAGAEPDTGDRDFHALQDVSVEIRKGESWGVIGVNGSGKSTLLKVISGNLRPSRGSVTVDGKVVILDYSSGLNGEFTGRENIYLKSAIFGLTRRQVDARFQSIADFADIGEFIDRPVKIYSSGMVARLGFAIMAHVEADIMITDEALAVGDAFFVQRCMAYIRSFLRHGTFLFVTHSLNEVVALCQKAIWIDHGKVQAIGTAKDVTDLYLSSRTLSASRRFLEQTELEPPPEPAATLAAAAKPAAPGSVTLAQPELAELADMRPPRVVRDPRLDFVNCSPWRNDIEMPAFDPATAGFGVGGAKIEEVVFEDEGGNPLSWIIGAETVRLVVAVAVERDLKSPIVGFQVKDRLGQVLFADNTYLTTLDRPLSVAAGQRFTAEFCFQMPLLPVGDYVVRAGIAAGKEDDNAMLHCIDNALVFQSTTSGVRHGLVGVPMQYVRVGVA